MSYDSGLGNTKQKTAIRRLIDEMNFVLALWKEPSNEMDGEHILKQLIIKAEELEPVNEQQIIDAYCANMGEVTASIKQDANDYFNETFEK